MIELEKTYLAKRIPEDLKNFKFKEIIDVYIPKDSDHPKIRLRKSGDKFELTKKEPINDKDASSQEEQTIILTEIEFNILNQQIKGKKIHKIRYFYNYNGNISEFDIFQDKLLGLIVIDFEFKTLDEKEKFKMPDFCLVEVTQEDFIAGGRLCGKSYEDIKDNLKKFKYNKLFLK